MADSRMNPEIIEDLVYSSGEHIRQIREIVAEMNQLADDLDAMVQALSYTVNEARPVNPQKIHQHLDAFEKSVQKVTQGEELPVLARRVDVMNARLEELEDYFKGKYMRTVRMNEWMNE